MLSSIIILLGIVSFLENKGIFNIKIFLKDLIRLVDLKEIQLNIAFADFCWWQSLLIFLKNWKVLFYQDIKYCKMRPLADI